MRLGALREQQQLREDCFPEMIVRRGLEPSNGTESKKGDTGDAAQGLSEVSRGSTGACCPVHARWIQPRQNARNAGGACEGGRRTYTPQYAPDKAWDTTPRVYVRFLPGALVPAALCVHAATLRRPPRSGEARFRTWKRGWEPQ